MGMKQIITFIVLSLVTCGIAQGQSLGNKTLLTVEYSQLFVAQSGWPHPCDEIAQLLYVGEKCSRCHSITSRAHRLGSDDENVVRIGADQNDLFQGIPEGQMTCKAAVSSNRFYYIEPLPDFDWQILDSDSVVCGYECQKARTSFRGRTWTVWFSIDLPYSFGPWKLGGLPGLILKAIDDKKQYSFEAIEIKKGDGKAIKVSTTGLKKSSPEQVFKEIMTRAKNPTKYEIDLGRLAYFTEEEKRHFHIEPYTAYPIEYFDEKIE